MKTFLLALISFCALSAWTPLPTDPLIELDASWRPIYTAEEQPRFHGCEQDGLDGYTKKNCSDRLLLRYIYSQITYPEAAQRTGVQKEVTWIPGEYKGEAVNVQFNLPIHFQIKNGSKSRGRDQNADYEQEHFGRLRRACTSAEFAATAQQAVDQTAEDIYSCFGEPEKEMTMRATALFLQRMNAYYPDSREHPFQTFLQQYKDKAIDNAFFGLDEPQHKAFREALPWTTYSEPEDDYHMEIIPPQSVQEKVKKENQKLAEAQYPDENIHLAILSPYTNCLYEMPADEELMFFYKRYSMIGFLESWSKANLMLGFLTESHFQQEAVQNLIAVEIFLQRCMNTK